VLYGSSVLEMQYAEVSFTRTDTINRSELLIAILSGYAESSIFFLSGN